MLQEYKRVIIVSSIAIVLLVLLIVFALSDITLGPISIPSIKTILSQYDKVKLSEEDLASRQEVFNTTLASLEKSKQEFNKEKKEYDSISDETVNIIKEATTQEEYSIEYMWIRLGNYAKMNNLSIILIEPGGMQESSKAGQSSQTTTTTTTTTNTSNSTNNNANTNSSTNTSTNNTSNTNNNNTSNTNNTNNTNTVTLNNNNNNSQNGETFKIQVSGSYMNVSDFVFQVENDNELKFKLDNISMEYVSGTTIKATFDVKNMVIKK